MRHVLVKSKTSAKLVGINKVSLIVHDNVLKIPKGSTLMHNEWIRVDDPSIRFEFEPSQKLVERGVIIVGAYVEGEEVRLYLYNTGSDIELKRGEVFAVAYGYDTIHLRDTKENFVGGVLIVQSEAPPQRPTIRGGGKRKKKE